MNVRVLLSLCVATYTKKSGDEYVLEETWEIPNMGSMKVMEIAYKRTE